MCEHVRMRAIISHDALTLSTCNVVTCVTCATLSTCHVVRYDARMTTNEIDVYDECVRRARVYARCVDANVFDVQHMMHRALSYVRMCDRIARATQRANTIEHVANLRIARIANDNIHNNTKR